MMNVTSLLILAFLLGCNAKGTTVGQDQNTYSDEIKPSVATYLRGKKLLIVLRQLNLSGCAYKSTSSEFLRFSFNVFYHMSLLIILAEYTQICLPHYRMEKLLHM